MTLVEKHIRDPFSEDYTVDVPEVKHVHVFVVSVLSASWTAIQIPAGHHCESVLAKCRTSTYTWQLSHADGGAYITFEAGGSLSLDIDANAGDTLFYIKSSTNDTFEVMIGY